MSLVLDSCMCVPTFPDADSTVSVAGRMGATALRRTLYSGRARLPTGIGRRFCGKEIADCRLPIADRFVFSAFMKNLNLLLAAVILASVSCVASAAEGKRMLYHVVTVKFKEGAKPEQIKEAEKAFAALKEKIPGIVTLNWGTNVSPEKKDKGFTHCFVLTFASEKDRDAYLPHPEHKAFGKVLGPVVGDVMVIDFWSQE